MADTNRAPQSEFAASVRVTNYEDHGNREVLLGLEKGLELLKLT